MNRLSPTDDDDNDGGDNNKNDIHTSVPGPYYVR